MGWTNELYQVYELASKNPDSGLLPLFHTNKSAQIELVIDERGNFRGANALNKDNAATIIPVTEKSAGRTSSTIAPHPFVDELAYIAGDFFNYVSGNDKNKKKYQSYCKQLKSWVDSEYTHDAVSAVYKYLSKAVLIEDLVKSDILQLDTATGALHPKEKLTTTKLEKCSVRFVVQYDDISRESRTWLDSSLYDSFISFYAAQIGNEELCYATGKILPVTYNHPKNIISTEANAKLISANDSNGFTYLGRFATKEEAFVVSYDFSQKMHNALKWLIREQGHSFGSLTLVTWASALEKLPDELGKPIEREWNDEEVYHSFPDYKSRLNKYIMGFKQEFRDTTKVMIMALDAATTGRLSIALYDELQGSIFLDNLEKWHENSAWLRFRKGQNTVCSFSLYEIVRAAYGFEQNGKTEYEEDSERDTIQRKKGKAKQVKVLECDEKLERDQILRLLPCVMNGRDLPYDLVQALYYKASNPLAYERNEKNDNHRKVMEVVCGMYRAWKKGAISMAYDSTETDRSYLYGCLLAIADKAESDTYDEKDKKNRLTNARRYWANFAQYPYRVWQNIEERLRPYLDRHEYRTLVEKQMEEIMDKFTPEAFKNNSHLEPMYLLGYHHYMAHMYKKTKEVKNDGNVTAEN